MFGLREIVRLADILMLGAWHFSRRLISFKCNRGRLHQGGSVLESTGVWGDTVGSTCSLPAKKVSMTCLPSVPVTTNHKGILHGERVKAERAAAETIPLRVVLLVLRGVAEHSGGGCVFVFVNLVM